MKKGISLIVLVITIIVMIIIAGAIIISLNSSNVISKANEAVVKTDVGTLNDKLTLAYVDLRATYPTKDTYNETDSLTVGSITATGITDYYHKAVKEVATATSEIPAGYVLQVNPNGSAEVVEVATASPSAQ